MITCGYSLDGDVARLPQPAIFDFPPHLSQFLSVQVLFFFPLF